jgi:DNA-binding response OmpR family regulator
VSDRKHSILLITGTDDTYRRVLLESQGYAVTAAQADEALSVLLREEFHFVLVTSGVGLPNASAFCDAVRLRRPKLRIGVVARRGEHVPLERCADVVIRSQYSPAKFNGAINTVLFHEQNEA